MSFSPRTRIANKAQPGYRRGDLCVKPQLMEAWVEYCATPKADKVVPLRKQVLS